MLSPLTDMWPVRIIVSLVVRPLRRAVAYCAGRRFVYTLTGYCKPHGEERAKRASRTMGALHRSRPWPVLRDGAARLLSDEVERVLGAGTQRAHSAANTARAD